MPHSCYARVRPDNSAQTFTVRVAGATVNMGVMGFGVHLHLHRRRLLGVSDDRPVTITAVEGEARIRQVIPEVRELLAGQGLIVLLDAEVIRA